MAYGVIRLLVGDLHAAWVRWRGDLVAHSLQGNPSWTASLHWASVLSKHQNFPGYAAAISAVGLIVGARALRLGHIESTLSRWFTVLSLFTLGFVLERFLHGRSVAMLHWTPDWDMAFVVLWVAALWPAVIPVVRGALSLFAGFVGVTQLALGHRAWSVTTGAAVALVLILMLRVALRGLWRLSLWRYRT